MRASAVAVLALPVLAAATVLPRDGDCNTGSISCCNSVMQVCPSNTYISEPTINRDTEHNPECQPLE